MAELTLPVLKGARRIQGCVKCILQIKIKIKDELFQELLESVKQGAAIKKGTIQPSRMFKFPDTEVRLLREQFGLSSAITDSIFQISERQAG
jgi:hypothetical protein